jgi:hypothetical protein
MARAREKCAEKVQEKNRAIAREKKRRIARTQRQVKNAQHALRT